MKTETERNTTGETKRPFRKRRGFQVAAGIVGAGVLGIAWFLLSPLFINRTVIEDFPTVSVAEAGAGAAETPDDDSSADPATDDVAGPTSPESGADDEAAAIDESAEPIVLAQGEFVGADASHKGSGTATIYELEDGSRILRLENFDVTNGPALRVIISPSAAPDRSVEVKATGYLDLGGLKGNRGEQNYEIPADAVLPDGEYSIVIYCEPFSVIFATATVSA